MSAKVSVVGHPFGPLGTSRAARSVFASFRAAGVDTTLFDVWGQTTPEPRHALEMGPFHVRQFGDFNVFQLNGDEVEPALQHLGGLPKGAVNAVYPMWELPRYPSKWARELDRFDEVWAATRFIAQSIEPAVKVPVIHLPLATQLSLTSFRSRRFFGMPESLYAFLFFFDLRSYSARKNPEAVIEAFELFLSARPWAQACLVMKVHGAANAPEAAEQLRQRIDGRDERMLLIDRQMTEEEIGALIYSCDAFVSLHRAEGYGLGLAEAMALGKPVIGTGYSGNLDFMDQSVAHLVDYRLVPVERRAYPEWQGQVWAEPDVEHAARLMTMLYDDPAGGRRLGRRGGQHMQAFFSFRAAGLRYVSRLDERLRQVAQQDAAP